MPNPQCPICDADCAAYTEKDGYSLYRCGSCALIFLHPIPSAAELGRLYEEDWANKNQWCENEDRAFVPKKRLLRVWRWRRKASRLQSLSDGTRLLEIGCGSGDYLAAAARAGFTDIFGIEPSAREAEYARTRGFEVTNRIFEDVDFGDRKFDAIVVRHVIEHVADPVQVLVRARDLLAPNGHTRTAVRSSGAWTGTRCARRGTSTSSARRASSSCFGARASRRSRSTFTSGGRT